MALILAIEPDAAQAAQLTNLFRTTRLGDELVLAQTTEHALVAIGDRVPNLVLTPALLSPQEDAALAGALRAIAAAARVPMLTIPLLVDAPPPPARTGLLARWRRGRTAPPATGCAPALFGEQIAAYLSEAADELPVETAECERTVETDETVPTAIEPPVMAVPEIAPIEAPPLPVIELPALAAPIDEPASRAVAEMVFAPSAPAIREPIAEPIAEPIVAAIEQPSVDAIAEPSVQWIAEPIVEAIAEPIVEVEPEPIVAAIAAPLAEAIAEPIAAIAEPIEEPIAEPIVAAIAEPFAAAIAEPIAEPMAAAVAEPIPEPIAEPAVEAITVPVVALIATPAVEPIAAPIVEPVAEPVFRASAVSVEPIPVSVDPPVPHLLEASADLDPLTESAGADPVPAEILVLPPRPAPPVVVAPRPAATVPPRAAVPETPEVPPVPYVSQAELDQMFLQRAGFAWSSEGVRRKLDAAAAATPPPPPAPARTQAEKPEKAAKPDKSEKSEKPEWLELIESLRLDVERLRAERAQPAPESRVAMNPTRRDRVAGASRKDVRAKASRPAQDQWGLFDPDQCGFRALIAKLEEITDTSELRA